MTEQQDGVPLAGGRMTSGIVRYGDRIRRPAGRAGRRPGRGGLFLARELRWIHRLSPDLARAL
jgi:hypothetical protein